jgi:cytochrome d ubiquinol oxidase subunit I
MDPLILARMQFAITTVYHFFFVPLTLGLSVLVAIMETMYVRSGKKVYKDMTKFWGTLFVINFAIGVVTGIVQEFQFGMNWSEYSRFVGDIFGAPLAIEALLAFFLESVFIGVWLFGWDKLSKGAHAAAMWLIAIGSNISALWILIANSFMQEPVGYTIENGRAVMTDFFALIFNPNVWVQFPHVFLAGMTTASFFVMGISAYHLLKKREFDAFRRAFQIGAISATMATILLIFNGHTQTQHMVQSQPMKMASAEALWNTEEPASISILTIGDLSQRREIFSIRIPALLCLLSYNTFDCQLRGIYDLQAAYEAEFGPGNYIPPVAITYWSFRIMVGVGFLMAALSFYALYLLWRDVTSAREISLKVFLLAIALPYIANTSGWILTEIGRFPWIVYALMKIESGVSNMVSGNLVLVSLLGFTMIYGALMAADIYLMVKYSKTNISNDEASPDVNMEQAPSLVGTLD